MSSRRNCARGGGAPVFGLPLTSAFCRTAPPLYRAEPCEIRPIFLDDVSAPDEILGGYIVEEQEVEHRPSVDDGATPPVRPAG
jgi:hypothetical protein